MRELASTRYNNPDAMWGGSPLAKKWGVKQTVGLNDGSGRAITQRYSRRSLMRTLLCAELLSIELCHVHD
jgi:hypothetical protein